MSLITFGSQIDVGQQTANIAEPIINNAIRMHNPQTLQNPNNLKTQA
ncbi:hypothetical protein N9A04_00270 [Rickettsiales bacterium]|nr:hypothetical protein [Rickettsiales bacterium]